MLHSAGTSTDTKRSKAEEGAQGEVHVRDAEGAVHIMFPDGFSCEVALENVAGSKFVQGLQEIAAASSPPTLCLSMPAVQHRCLRAWLEAVNAGAEWLQQADAGTVAQ